MQGSDAGTFDNLPYINGSIFKLTYDGRLRTIYGFNDFNGQDGDFPASLLQTKDGSVYGITYAGGGLGQPYAGFGTIFKFDSGSDSATVAALSILYRFMTDTSSAPLPGTIVLANSANSYSGGTIITAGTLQLGAANALPSGGDLQLTGTVAKDTHNNNCFAPLTQDRVAGP